MSLRSWLIAACLVATTGPAHAIGACICEQPSDESLPASGVDYSPSPFPVNARLFVLWPEDVVVAATLAAKDGDAVAFTYEPTAEGAPGFWIIPAADLQPFTEFELVATPPSGNRIFRFITGGERDTIAPAAPQLSEPLPISGNCVDSIGVRLAAKYAHDNMIPAGGPRVVRFEVHIGNQTHQLVTLAPTENYTHHFAHTVRAGDEAMNCWQQLELPNVADGDLATIVATSYDRAGNASEPSTPIAVQLKMGTGTSSPSDIDPWYDPMPREGNTGSAGGGGGGSPANTDSPVDGDGPESAPRNDLTNGDGCSIAAVPSTSRVPLTGAAGLLMMVMAFARRRRRH